MSFVQIMLIAFSLAIDAFTVSITIGIKAKRIKILDAFKVGLFFGGFQFLMAVAGFFLANIFKAQILAFYNLIAFIILFIIGIKMIFESFKKDELKTDDMGNILSLKNLTVLAIATSIDALAVGFSFSINTNVGILFIVIGIVAFVLSFLGAIAGKQISNLFSKNAERLGGAILIFIAIKILLEYFHT